MKRFLLLIAAALTMGCGNMMADNTKGIYINEFMSNPSKDADYDWIEVYNSTDATVSLKGWTVERYDGKKTKKYTFADDQTIGAKGFFAFYVAKALGSFGIGKAGGDVLTLKDADGNSQDEVTAPLMDNGGTSYGRIPDGGATWKIFDEPTMGASNGVDPQLPTEDSSLKGVLFINEVLTKPATKAESDWVEIYNSSDKTIDLSGYCLEDDKGVAEKFTIPAGTTIAAKGFLLYSQGATGSTTSFTFGLSGSGDDVYLVDPDNKLVDHVTTPDFSDAAGSSYARKTDGASEFEVCASPTKGTSNGGTTSIKQIRKDSANGLRYNLQGQRVGSNYHGLVIVDGKKVMVK